MAFHFFSDSVSLSRQANLPGCFAKCRGGSTALTQLFLLFMMAAVNKLCAAVVVYGYEDAACV